MEVRRQAEAVVPVMLVWTSQFAAGERQIRWQDEPSVATFCGLVLLPHILHDKHELYHALQEFVARSLMFSFCQRRALYGWACNRNRS